jgi:hypothetical protein
VFLSQDAMEASSTRAAAGGGGWRAPVEWASDKNQLTGESSREGFRESFRESSRESLGHRSSGSAREEEEKHAAAEPTTPASSPARGDLLRTAVRRFSVLSNSDEYENKERVGDQICTALTELTYPAPAGGKSTMWVSQDLSRGPWDPLGL